MGIGITELQFLKFAKKNYFLGDVLTLGRQQIGINSFQIENELKKSLGGKYNIMDYCEDLLKNEFGANSVTSLDYSDYEGCTITGDIGDLNLNIKKKFNTIIDFGTIEHIFDIGNAFRNINKLLVTGGIVLHSNPANSFCGHGFWQLSHELFFSIYNKENGYSDTRVFIKDFTNKYNEWFEFKKSEPGKRLVYCSKECVGNLVISKKIINIEKLKVYQTLYDIDWSSSQNKNLTIKNNIKKNNNITIKILLYLRSKIKKLPLFFIISFVRSKYHKFFIQEPQHFTRNNLIKANKVKDLIN
jgi:hypothetical protein